MERPHTQSHAVNDPSQQLWQTTVGFFRGELDEGGRSRSSGESPVGRPHSEWGFRSPIRFNKEEKKCFKRLPTPSSGYEGKAEVFWQTTGEIRKALSESGLHTLPPLKGDFWQSQELKQPLQTKQDNRRHAVFNTVRETGHNPVALPIEAPMTKVLEQIYPRQTTPPGQRLRRSTGEFFIASDFWKNASGKINAVEAFGSPRQAPMKGRKSEAFQSMNVGMMSKTIPKQLDESEAKRAMMDFRRKVLERYLSVQEAFDSFDIDTSKELTMKEWNSILAKSEICSHREARLLFEHIDKNRDGSLTVYEFHVAIEAVAPIRKLEDVRKRWLAYSFSSMHQAIQQMVPEGSPEGSMEKRLSLQEFGALLSKVHITDSDEHLAIFSQIRDPGSSSWGAPQSVSVSELASAMATVSPSILLEDLRDRILNKYTSFELAYYKLDMDKTGTIDMHEFVRNAEKRLHMLRGQAIKAFREIDIDGSGSISKAEFIGAFNLSVPSLLVEDFRKKILQRFRSILRALQETFATQDREGLDDELKLGLEEFAQILAQIEISYKDTQRLFKLIDVDRDGALTMREFAKGVRLFAPACVLENLRLNIVTHYATAAEAFVTERIRHEGRTFEEFRKMLASCQPDMTTDVDVQAVFDLLDFSQDGRVSLSELIAALQSGQPGTQVKLSRDERDLRAKQTVRVDLQPFHKIAGDLRLQVRTGMQMVSTPEEKKRPENRGQGASGVPEKEGKRKGKKSKRKVPQGEKEESATEQGDHHKAAAKLIKHNKDEIGPAKAIFEPAKQSFQRLQDHWKKQLRPNTERMENLLGYYKGANKTLATHVPLLVEQQSVFQNYQDLSHHHDVLKRGTRRDGPRDAEASRTEYGGMTSSMSAPQLSPQA